MVDATEIKELRKRLGLNQTEFAELIGSTQIQVSRWETGRVKPIKMAVNAMKRIEEPRPRTFGEDGPVYDAG
jgi:DNA-binding transcriptional regulator YiaG